MKLKINYFREDFLNKTINYPFVYSATFCYEHEKRSIYTLPNLKKKCVKATYYKIIEKTFAQPPSAFYVSVCAQVCKYVCQDSADFIILLGLL